MTRRKAMFAGLAALGATATAGWGAGWGRGRVPGEAAAAAKQGKGFEVTKTQEEWRESLTPEQFEVLRAHGTERAWTSPLNDEKRAGAYLCAGCGQPVFASATKYESGSGWPSFYQPIAGAVGTAEDRKLFMTRTEVHCSRCGGHLGHVFDDGPPPTGKRYCMNGVALRFVPDGAT
jgi:peptide-methionine (R)-S-oxide reductase